MLIIVLILVGLIVLPIIAFFGLIGLGLFVWSWRRVGPYFVDFGRWIGNWRNYVPCGCLLFGGIVFLLVIAAVLPQQFDIFRIVLLVLVGIAFAVCSMFAVVIWSIRLGRWIWPRFKQGFWGYVERGWDMLSKGVSGDAAPGARRPGKRPRPRPKAGADEAAAPAGAHGLGAKPAARVMPPARRSLLDLSWLWAMVWGKPGKRVQSANNADRTSPQRAQAAAPTEPSTPPRVPAKPKAGLRPLMWRLGLLGKPRQLGGKAKPAAPKVITESPREPVRPVPLEASQLRPPPRAPAAKAAETKMKPTVVLGPRAKRSTLGPMGGLGRSIGNGLEGLRRGFWAGAFWVVSKARGGLNSVLRLLHLGGKRR